MPTKKPVQKNAARPASKIEVHCRPNVVQILDGGDSALAAITGRDPAILRILAEVVAADLKTEVRFFAATGEETSRDVHMNENR